MWWRVLLFVWGLEGIAYGQTVVSVDIARAILQWDWVQGTGGAVEKFNVKCGQTATTVTKVTAISDPAARSVPVQNVISGQGNWFCTVNAENQFGVSGDSNQLPFVAGAVASSPSNVRIQVK